MSIINTTTPGYDHEALSPSGLRNLRLRGAQLFFGALTAASLLAAPAAFAQLPYSEDFTTTTYKDTNAGQTTAEWSGTGQLLLPVSPELTGVTFDDTTTVEVLPGDFITRDVKFADMDGDGDLDIVEGTLSTNGVYLNDGTGSFGARVFSSSASNNTRSIAVGDVDRDGDIDFVAGNFASRILLYLNDGTGTSFTVQDVAAQGRQTNSVALVDVDGDGYLDVVAANLGFQVNYIYWNTKDPVTPFGAGGSAGFALDPAIREESRRVVAGDIDNDGDVDLVFMNESEPNPNNGNRQQRNRVYMNQGARSFTHEEIEIPASNDIRVSHGGALGDLNGDGYLDLVIVNFGSQTLIEPSQIYFNDASGPGNNPFTIAAYEFTDDFPGTEPQFQQSGHIADADHDGDLDVYLVISGHQFRNRVYFNDGSGTITAFADVGPVGQAPLVLDPTDVGAVSNDGDLGDVDGDGDLDWVLGNQETKPSTAPLANMLLRNSGVAAGPAQLQLHAKATSLTVDTSGVGSVKLSPSPAVTMPENTFIDYWVTGNGGLSWSPIFPDGRPVPISAGSDVRWRAELRSNSPTVAGGLAINNLDIAANTTGASLTTPLGDQSVTEGISVFGANIFVDFDDLDGDQLFYSISGLPPGTGLSITATTGQLLGVPTNDDTLASPIAVTVTATDGAFSATDAFNINVTNSNDAPAFTSLPPDLDVGPPATSGATQDVLYTYNITATDPDPGDTAGLVITATHPAWMTLVDNGGGSATLSGTPTAGDVFDLNQAVLITVTDSSSATDTQSFSMAITNVNDAPTFTSTPVTAATQDSAYIYDITVSDPDDTDTLVITATAIPAWLTLTDNGDGTATLAGTPGNDDVGDHAVQIDVDDGTTGDSQSFTVSVADVNDAPTFTSTPITTGTQNVLYTAAITTEDIDGDAVTISAVTLPVWLTLTDHGNGTATLSGTPSNANVGNNDVELTVSDGSASGSQSFVIAVANVNDDPSFTSTPVTSAVQDVVYTYNITTSDPDVDVLTITAPTLPAWLTLVDNGDGTATLSGTPTNADVGANNVQLQVSDGSASVNQAFVISVSNVDDAPEFTSGPITSGTQGTLYTYLATASDPDGDPLSFGSNVLPSWLTFIDNGNGTATLSGTPGSNDVGNNPVELTVTDGSSTVTQAFNISVANVNDAPEFTSTALTAATEATLYTYTAVATDADGDSVTISASTLPAWLTFTDNLDGTASLAGTPSGSDVGVHSVQLVVTEVGSGGLSGSQDFTITVTAAADGPTVTLIGNASITIDVGSAYTDQGATATDPQDGDLTDQIVVDNPVNTSTAGTYTVTYTVSDSAGNSAQAQRTVTVRAAAPPPPRRSGGGGSFGLGESLLLALFALAATARRRRSNPV